MPTINKGDLPRYENGEYGQSELTQAVANAEVAALLNPSSGSGGGGGGSTTVDFGNKITDATIPTGGVGNLGWLSAIWKLVSDRIPALSNGKIPVEVGSLSVSISRNSTLTNTAVQVKASDGLVLGWNFINTNSVTVYVKFYNLATDVTVGTSPVLLTQAVPGGSASNSGINFLEVGLVPQEVFSEGISIACVTGLADNSTTAPITPIYAEVRYK